jgi:predicted ester cyclase
MNTSATTTGTARPGYSFVAGTGNSFGEVSTLTANERTEHPMQDAGTVMVCLAREVLSAGNLDQADQLVAHDVIDHSGFPGQPAGRAGMKQRWGMLLEAFPDFDIEVHQVIVDGEHVSMRCTGRGTHLGVFAGIQPTGRAVQFTEINLSRVVDGRLVEHWAERSNLEVLLQLGVSIPGY